MKNAPFRIAMFGLLITVVRIAMFVAIIDSGFGPLLGKIFAASFAIFIAAGVYVSSFFVRHIKTRWASLLGLFIFGIADLWFNEATVIFYTSSAQIIPPDSNFMGITSQALRSSMQFTALGFGVLPTLGMMVLGWMQAGAGSVAELNKPNLLTRIGMALGKVVTGWGIAVAIRLESQAKVSQKDSPQDSRQEGGYDWRRLSDGERAQLTGKDTRQIKQLYPGIDERTALNWYNRANKTKVS